MGLWILRDKENEELRQILENGCIRYEGLYCTYYCIGLYPLRNECRLFGTLECSLEEGCSKRDEKCIRIFGK